MAARFLYNLFRLFFLASIFFLSTGTFTLSGPSFLGAADAPPGTAQGAAFLSCEFRPNAFVAVEVDSGARTVWDWSLFRDAVESEIAPLLDLFLGLSAWMLVYSLHMEAPMA